MTEQNKKQWQPHWIDYTCDMTPDGCGESFRIWDDGRPSFVCPGCERRRQEYIKEQTAILLGREKAEGKGKRKRWWLF